jgi:glutamate/tyrosine decarboxylase-like PLP-dependent enzyme
MDTLSLDPSNWDEIRLLGIESLEIMLNHLKNIREEKVWREVPEEVKNFLNQPLPLDPDSEKQILEDCKKFILPYALGNVHPRFWGWVVGSGTPFQIITSILTSGMNSPGGSFQQITTYMEIQLLEWVKKIFSFPENASGLLVSGGSMANYVGLSVARQSKIPFDVREEGLQQSNQYFTLYTSSEMHFSVIRAIEALGFGRKALRKIGINKDYSINIQSLEEQISKDKKDGYIPICIIGTAGTVNTGAIDDLEQLSEICKRENLWFHVDGAFGALLILSQKYKERVKGISQADSIAFDFHKWMHINYEAAFALIRNHDLHRNAFAQIAHYTSSQGKGVSAGPIMFSDYGLELSREFKALKVWMSIKEHGINKFALMIEKNIEQAQYLGSLIQNHDELQLVSPILLQIVCFRFIVPNFTNDRLNTINYEILIKLQESGIAVPSSTILDDKYVIRVSITNHRSEKSDFDLFIKEVLSIGNQLASEYN